MQTINDRILVTQDSNEFLSRSRSIHREVHCIRSEHFTLECSGPLYYQCFKRLKPIAITAAASIVAITSDPQRVWIFAYIIGEKPFFTIIIITTSFARTTQPRQLIFEPYLDVALHDVLLHLPSQIPDHMPYTDSFLVLLLPLLMYRAGYTIYTLNNNFLGKMK